MARLSDVMWFAPFSYLLLLLASPTSSSSSGYSEDEVIASIDGVVGGGNYSRYSFSEKEPSKLVLSTHEGDADLFVSDIHAEPTYDFDNHELTSGTCGLDVVYLTKDLQRPINIAVYGNPRYEKSYFSLEVIYQHEGDDPFTLAPEEQDDFMEFDEKPKGGAGMRQKQQESGGKSHRGGDDDLGGEYSVARSIFSVLQQVLLILLEVLL